MQVQSALKASANPGEHLLGHHDHDEGKPVSPVDVPYVLALNVPTYRDSAGKRYADRLWYKDLKEHVRYLKKLTVVAPAGRYDGRIHLVSLSDDAEFDSVRFVDLPAVRGWSDALRQLPALFKTLRREIRSATIVHTGIAGWPFPIGWLAAPLSVAYKKKLVVVVESAFWRVPAEDRLLSWSGMREWFFELINRCCVNSADLPIFTQPEYQATLLTKQNRRGFVINASWISRDCVLTAREGEALWATKLAGPGALRLVFAGRLVREKGLFTLLEALEMLEKQRLFINVDIIGEGPLEPVIRSAADRLKCARVRVLGSMEYGPTFLSAIESYHALVVPSLSDEQPRVVYDSYARGVPVIASDTDGLKACVLHGTTGFLFSSGDAAGLAAILTRVSLDLPELRQKGLNALSVARKLTHEVMHEQRWELLCRLLEGSLQDSTLPSTRTP